MGLIREPDGVDFVISGHPLSEPEAAEVSDFLKKGRESRAKVAREQLEAEALKLPVNERTMLAHRLIDSLAEVEELRPKTQQLVSRRSTPKRTRPSDKSRRRRIPSTQ